MSNSGHAIVLAIPTRDRTASLAALLESVLPQLQRCPAQLIVADNACGTEVPRLLARFGARWPDSAVIAVRSPGVVAVRNALLQAAHRFAPAWRWLVMLDDNCLARADWLQSLLANGSRLDAHIVGGPAEGCLPRGGSWLAPSSLFAARRAWPTGVVPMLNGAHNIAIARKTLELLGEPLFCADYAVSGGEDYELFRRVIRAGGRLAWCQEAAVVKTTAVERLTTSALLYRYASTGAYMAAIDRRYDGALGAWALALKGTLGASVRLAAATATVRRDPIARALLALSHYGGRIGGLLGVRTHRYALQRSSL